MLQFFFILFHDKYIILSHQNCARIFRHSIHLKSLYLFQIHHYNSDVEILSMCLSSGDINRAEFMSTIDYSPSNSTDSDQEKTSDEYVVISSSTSIDNIQDDNR